MCWSSLVFSDWLTSAGVWGAPPLSIWPKGHRAISNYRRYRFGLMGLISVVLMSRMKVTAIYSYRPYSLAPKVA
jgi:hypothetical protein